MLDISVIILTYNEEVHIQRCIEKVKSFAKYIYVVDSLSTDKTAEMAVSLGAIVVPHAWPGNQAAQFNWALEHINIETEWILRLDADEYLLPELVEELNARLPSLEPDITGVTFKRRHIFLGRWMKRGTYPTMILRLFKYRKAVCEQRLMDEHIELLEGRSVTFENDFVDHNLNNIGWWANKHVGYAIREAAELLDVEYNITGVDSSHRNLSPETLRKRKLKLSYAKKPLFLRAMLYFVYRYIFKMAFLEGKEGFLWSFLQGWWYRTLVDVNIYEIKKACNNDKEKIVSYLKDNYNITL